jgi:SAM-dependent methyltransferase
MPQTINYDEIAGVYARTRAAAPWIVATVARYVAALPAASVIIELGCGTGNHVRALAERYPHHHYAGFDQSAAMLHQAQLSPNQVHFRQGDAQQHWPYADASARLVFNVDVIHYITDLPTFFQEAWRVLQPGGTLLIATDAEADLRRRSLTQFFPEILEHELARYPTLDALQRAAATAGFAPANGESVTGSHPITDEQLANLAAQCSSALRLISPAALATGLARVRAAQGAGEPWHSCYTVYQYTKLQAR